MASVTLPAPVAPLPVLISRPVGVLQLGNDLRAALVNGKDVQAWAEGSSGDAFGGQAADASRHALTRFSRRLDVTEAALESAVVATSRFEDRLARLSSQRLTLDGDRVGLNTALDDLRAEVAGASDAEVPLLQARADRLQQRAARLLADVVDWATRVADAEADFVAALARVDTFDDGRRAARDPGRAEVDGVLGRLGAGVADPAAVAAWWRLLSRAERQTVITEHPAIIGNLPGIPARDRDAANRADVGADVDELGTRVGQGEQLTSTERDRLANASAVSEILDDHRDDLDPRTGEHLLHLTQYQPDEHSGDGGVALFLGDPDRADHVAVYVPGTLSETGTLDGTLGNIDALHRAATDAGDGLVAVGFWLDYDAPSIDGLSPGELADLGSVVTPTEAAAGGDDLADYLDGLRASDTGPPAHLSLIGHSYGATTSSYAAHGGAPIDDLVLLGSPGAPTSTADALTSAEVHVGSADHDPVTLLGTDGPGGPGLPGPLGQDPAQDSFGGRRFEVDPGSYRVQDLLANHSSYFADESLDGVTGIVIGNDPDEVAGRQPGGYQTLDQLVLGSTVASGGEWLWERGNDAVDGLTGTVHDLAEGLLGLPYAFHPGR
ncbi:alpha/beta hydrolase [Nocardioides caeni]|uniref:DUF1023 domain-containing protein n=1 Tax=Nocardioides caeni TaxID=574700 RepID=A0A4S8NMA5_9ACTN|nr:alpha/beta hydrolase [Nocardioides caeni]THV17978.1 hypothetical protein E9934_05900 [Nocardioides caeni]